jgi:hypothetical protein
MRSFLFGKNMEGTMNGGDSEIWGKKLDHAEHAVDLIGMKSREKIDWFSLKVAEHAVHLFKCGFGRLRKPDRNLGRQIYHDNTVLRITFVLTSALASLLPLASIIALNAFGEHHTAAKLGTIAAFMVFSAVCLTLFTEARRTDVFSVTAA